MLLSADRNGRTRIDSAIPLLFALEGAWSIARAARDPQHAGWSSLARRPHAARYWASSQSDRLDRLAGFARRIPDIARQSLSCSGCSGERPSHSSAGSCGSSARSRTRPMTRPSVPCGTLREGAPPGDVSVVVFQGAALSTPLWKPWAAPCRSPALWAGWFPSAGKPEPSDART